MGLPAKYWLAHPEPRQTVVALTRRVLDTAAQEDEYLDRDMIRDIARFVGNSV